MKAYIAEAIGTCILTLVLILATGANPWVATIFAVFTLIYIAYSFGHVSGAHVNPALTIGALATGRIGGLKALYYVIAQIAGAAAAVLVVKAAGVDLAAAVAADFSWRLFFAEVIGMFVFGYGVAAVMAGRVHTAASGFVVGISLFGGIIVSSLLLSGTTMSAVLNPAVAYGLNALSISSILGAILGSVIGMWVFALLSENVKTVCANAKKALTGKDTDTCGCDATYEITTPTEGTKIA
jgi:aquaporin Z